MPVEVRVPALGESVVEATVGRWLKQEGDRVTAGDSLVELETEKVNLEVPAEQGGVLQSIAHGEGDTGVASRWRTCAGTWTPVRWESKAGRRRRHSGRTEGRLRRRRSPRRRRRLRVRRPRRPGLLSCRRRRLPLRPGVRSGCGF